MQAVAELAWEDRLDLLRDPEFKAKVIAEMRESREISSLRIPSPRCTK